QLGSCRPAMMCRLEKLRWNHNRLLPPFVKRNALGRKVNTAHVIGPAHRMVSSALLGAQKGLSLMDWEFAVPASEAHEALKMIKKLSDKHQLCLPFAGVFIRYATVSDSTSLAHT